MALKSQTFTATIPQGNPAASHYKTGDSIAMYGKVVSTDNGVQVEVDRCEKEKPSAKRAKSMKPSEYLMQRRMKA